ncbi:MULTISPECIES: DUF3263 domain-containing protein [Microbacterium]|uniref:DUF3263 domain-containing protein n=1 Tax=Microbacterium TaxID=33882 RepID=UPI0006FCEC98|nr:MULTISPECIES: DUF3263 domain-containing protein [Microbacterium]KAA0962869.1 DUF3263 domain-containing protein [Microbacterium sp. ANT_H45B]KQZ22686.1 hypothetical protein ASD43_15450 [Microbacterium sp. Root553]MCP1430747.1 hypothetical protein [Microbacterium foliorum]
MLGELSERDRAILALETAWPRHGGAKEETIRTQLGMSAARYYQLLGRLIDSDAALEYDPMLVRRLRRIRDSRSFRRASRAPGFVG